MLAYSAIAENTLDEVDIIIDYLNMGFSVLSSQGDWFCYFINESNEEVLVRYLGSAEKLILPSSLGDNRLAVINDNAFAGNETLKSVEIPYSVYRIGDGAFQKCINLISVNIPYSVREIADIGIFAACISLEQIIVDKGNDYYCDIDGVLYTKDKLKLCAYPAGRTAKSYDILDGTVEIGDFAFSCASKLRHVTIPSSVTTLGNLSFCDTYIESISIPNGIISIGERAFSYCSEIKTIYIPDSVISLGTQAFTHCDSLEHVSIPQSLSNTAVYTVDRRNLLQIRDK